MRLLPKEGNNIEKLDSITFDTFISKIDPFGKKNDVFDLKGIGFISPSALVQLAAVCHALKAQGRSPLIVLDNQSVCTYLSRAGFVSVLESVAQFESHGMTEVDYDYLRGSNLLLIEVTKIASGSALPAILDQIVDVLRKKFKYKKNDAFDVAIAVSEVCQNTFDHNKSTCGFLAMQVYGKGTKRFLEIGIADYGEGLANTLRRNPKNKGIVSDYDAIKYAIKAGTSEHDDPTRGTGLYHLLETVYKYQGSVHIRTGKGKIRYRMDLEQGWRSDVAFVPGVQIALTLNHKKRS